MSREADRYLEECELVAGNARAAGLRVDALILFDPRTRPGVVLAHPLSERVWNFAAAYGYVASPSGKRKTIIEVGR